MSRGLMSAMMAPAAISTPTPIMRTPAPRCIQSICFLNFTKKAMKRATAARMAGLSMPW